MTILNSDSSLYKKIRKRIHQVCVEAVTHRSISFPPELKNLDALDRALKLFDQRWPDNEADTSDDAPIFIFSAGWRSGSTLLQRLLCSAGDNLVWGEPIGDTAIIPRLAMSLSALTPEYPPDDYFANNIELASLSGSWIANLTPNNTSFKMAHRAFIEEWLAKPALEQFGVSKWGLKEVRFTIHHARYLKWLYPNARFIFIYRNLFDAYRSWRGNMWGSAWPRYYSWSPIAYARHWKLLLSGYLDGYQEIGGYLVKYEDLIAGRVDLKELAEYAGIAQIDSSVLKRKIGSPDEKKRLKRKKWITPVENILLFLIAGRLLKRAGY